jgi:hypothetical protein
MVEQSKTKGVDAFQALLPLNTPTREGAGALHESILPRLANKTQEQEMKEH